MELVDACTLPSSDSGTLPKRVQVVLRSRGSDLAFSLKDDVCGVALLEGTLTFISTVDDSAWGVKEMLENGCLDMVNKVLGRMTENPHHELWKLLRDARYQFPIEASLSRRNRSQVLRGQK
jgi:hypothetical protein